MAALSASRKLGCSILRETLVSDLDAKHPRRRPFQTQRIWSRGEPLGAARSSLGLGLAQFLWVGTSRNQQVLGRIVSIVTNIHVFRSRPFRLSPKLLCKGLNKWNPVVYQETRLAHDAYEKNACT